MTIEDARKLLETVELPYGEQKYVEALIEAAKLIGREEGREELEDEQRKDMSWTNWEEDFAETWMDINPNHGQANAKCYIKKLVDKYVEKAREEQRKVDAKIVQDTHDCLRGGPINEVLKVIFEETIKKILSPEAQQNISSKNDL